MGPTDTPQFDQWSSVKLEGCKVLHLGPGRPSLPLTGMGLSRGQDDTGSLRSRVRAPAVPEFLGEQVCDPPMPPVFSCLQMHCLTAGTLLRALAQAARAGRSRGAFPGCGGAQSPSMSLQLHSLSPLLAGPPSGRSLHSSAVAATYSESRGAWSLRLSCARS